MTTAAYGIFLSATTRAGAASIDAIVQRVGTLRTASIDAYLAKRGNAGTTASVDAVLALPPTPTTRIAGPAGIDAVLGRRVGTFQAAIDALLSPPYNPADDRTVKIPAVDRTVTISG